MRKISWQERWIHNAKVLFRRPPYTKGFGGPDLLSDHFKRHKSKLTCSDENDYQRQADAFLGGFLRKNTYTCFRDRDGSRLLYNVDSYQFGFINNGIVTSYYKTKQYKTLEQCLDYLERACK